MPEQTGVSVMRTPSSTSFCSAAMSLSVAMRMLEAPGAAATHVNLMSATRSNGVEIDHCRERAATMATIRPVHYRGLAAIQLVSNATRLVVVHEVGPRVAAFGADGGGNLLFWDDAGEHTRGEWRLYGGHRLWVTRPEADESEEAYLPDNAPCGVREHADGVTVTAPSTTSQVEKSISVRARSAGWIVEHRLRNCSDMLWSGGAWALTCTRPTTATRYRIPLTGGSERWDALTMVIPRRWGGTHTSRLVDPQFQLTETALQFRARGVEAKRMLSAPSGTLEMIDRRRGRFIKTAAYVPQGHYPLRTNVAVYLGPQSFMVELETMSPIATLAPGETLRHREFWTYRAK